MPVVSGHFGAVRWVTRAALRSLVFAIALVGCLNDLRVVVCTGQQKVTRVVVVSSDDLKLLHRDTLEVVGSFRAGELKHVATLCQPRRLTIDGGEDLTDEDVDAVVSLGSVEELELRNTPGITDAAFANAGQASKLSKVTVVGSAITDTAVESICKCPKLVDLDVSESKSITGTCLTSLGKLSELQKLNVSSCAIQANNLAGLATAKSLKVLKMQFVNGGDAATALLARLGQLEELSMGPQVTQLYEASNAEPGLRKLRALSLVGPRISQEVYPQIGNLPALESLVLNSCPTLDDGKLLALLKGHSFRKLGLQRCQSVTGPGLVKALAEQDTLQVLSLRSLGPLLGDGLAAATRIDSLRELDIWDDGDAGLVTHLQEYLSKSRGLVGLSYVADGTTDHGDMDALLAEVARHEKLARVRLHVYGRISDGGIRNLAKCRELRDLSLIHCSVLSDGIADTLVGLPTLEKVDLSWPAGKEKSFSDKFLTTMATHAAIKCLYLWGHENVSKAGIRAFRQRHPDCWVDCNNARS